MKSEPNEISFVLFFYESNEMNCACSDFLTYEVCNQYSDILNLNEYDFFPTSIMHIDSL